MNDRTTNTNTNTTAAAIFIPTLHVSNKPHHPIKTKSTTSTNPRLLPQSRADERARRGRRSPIRAKKIHPPLRRERDEHAELRVFNQRASESTF
jgi:hypothetical protein